MFFVACTERDVLNIEPNIMLTSPNNSFVARAYIDMWGGSAGGVDYVITILSPNKLIYLKILFSKLQKREKFVWIG